MATSRTQSRVAHVVSASSLHGDRSIICLSGVAGTGKTHVAIAAAHQIAGHPLFVRQIQFHPGYAYEDFIEGYRPVADGGFQIRDGVFYEWNAAALRDPSHKYVLLIEEFTRANISAVLGELMTYLEHRDRDFYLPMSRRSMRVASNLVVIATMNPRDRSALEVDDALIRRLRLIEFPPDTIQLREMLSGHLDAKVIDRLVHVFDRCKEAHSETYRYEMPFGHGMFAGVRNETDLRELWMHRLYPLLRRPLVAPHAFSDTITSAYEWASSPDDV